MEAREEFTTEHFETTASITFSPRYAAKDKVLAKAVTDGAIKAPSSKTSLDDGSFADSKTLCRLSVYDVSSDNSPDNNKPSGDTDASDSVNEVPRGSFLKATPQQVVSALTRNESDF